MPLSSLSKYAAYIAIALNLAACSYFLPNTTPTLGGLLAAKGDTRPFEVPLPVNTEPKRMALSSEFTIGVKADGTVWGWGSGTEGELGMGKKENRPTPQAIPNMTNFIEVAAGNHHVLALRKDGTVWSWGNNKTGALGYKEEGVPWGIAPEIRYDPYQLSPRQIPDLKDIVSIAAGSSFSLALDKEGRVWGWGSKLYVFSQDLNFKQPTPKLITQDVNAVKVIGKAPSDFGLLLKTGNVKLWRKGVLFEPVIDNVVDVAMNYSNTYFLLSTGRVYALGTNYSGELGQRHKEEFKHPLLIKQIGHIIKIDTYSALDDKGRVWQWGREAGMSIDKIFSGTNGYVQYYPKVMLSNKNIRDISCCTAALAEDGTVWFWGDDSAGRRGDNKRPKGSYQLQTHRHWTTPVRSLWRWK